jgi:HPt (histidine-containing phosphotransfer) domain-containing protein
MNRRKQECALLENFLENNNFLEIARIAHRLKGHGTSYGFAAISKLGCDLEETAIQKDKSKTPVLIKQYKELLNSY